MKWRAIVPALFVVILFIGGAYLYNRGFVHQRSHGVIFMIANGLDQEILNQARMKAAARGQKLVLDNFSFSGNSPHAAFLTVQGLETSAPDESAANTMIATGVKVKNGSTSFSANGQRLDNLIYRAQAYGRGTGLITTGELTMSTPVSFYGYIQGSESAEFRNAAELVDSSKINVIMGGGRRYFQGVHPENERGRLDGRDLEKDAIQLGYSVIHSAQELEKLPAWRTRECLALFTSGPFYFSPFYQGATIPSLSDMTRRSIEFLQYNLRGYFLVVEGALIAQASRSNLRDLAVDEAIAFDEAVKTALSYAGKESTVIVVCGYSYGAIPSISEPTKNVISRLKPEEALWLVGPGGTPVTASDKQWYQKKLQEGAFSSLPNHPLNPDAALRFSRQARPTTSPGWVMSVGFGSDIFSGSYSLADLYWRVEQLFQ